MLANLGALGSERFSQLFSLCETSLLPEAVRRSGRYRFAQALKLWSEGRRASAVEQLAAIASGDPDSFEAGRAREILAPPALGKRGVDDVIPLHLKTWSFGPGRGKGVRIELASYEVKKHAITLSFSVRSGDHKDLLLYAPRSVQERFGRNCEALYILDDTGRKFYSTTGWRGGRQSRFNSCATQVEFDPTEEVILSAEFPMVSPGATSIRFVSPNPDNAGHQDEWSWSDIRLKNGPFD